MASKKKKAEGSKLNTFRAGPNEQGFFGLFGGRFVAETLMPLILDLDAPTRPPRPTPRTRPS